MYGASAEVILFYHKHFGLSIAFARKIIKMCEKKRKNENTEQLFARAARHFCVKIQNDQFT